MHNRGSLVAILLALIGLGILLAFIPGSVTASQPPDSPLPLPVAPEPYPNTDIYPAQVYLATRDDLQLLYRLNVDFEGLRVVEGSQFFDSTTFKPAIATVYINLEQSDLLTSEGLMPVPIPNQGYRSFLAYGPGSGAPNAWPTFEEYVTRMQSLESAHPDIVRLVQIGQSVQGRGLYCLEITDNPDTDENEPEFKYTANHHGDETTGIEMVMRLAELLADGYGNDPVLSNIVDNMEAWLCPIYNPDGYTSGSRYNDHGVDLNRDFPDRFTDPIDDPQGREPETQAFMKFGYAHRFVMGANFHGGEQVLNYPWDAVAPPNKPIIPDYAPDDVLFNDFGIGYTSRNPDLWYGNFPQGITRGWEWYQIWGGMQDWAYYYHDEHHVTIEISWEKNPDYNLMDDFWDHNRDAMLWWMQRAMTGLNGLVLDASTNDPLKATITLVGEKQPNTILTDPSLGDYHRVISDGDYEIMAGADCYQSQTAQVSVISGTVATQDFMLASVPDLSSSNKTVSAGHALPGASLEYQVNVRNTCEQSSALVTDTLPSEITWNGYLTATAGSPSFEDGQILWQGEISRSEAITITYGVTVNGCLPVNTAILNLAEISDLVNIPITRTAEVTVDNALPTIPGNPEPADYALNQPITTTLSWSPSTDLNCDSISYRLYFGSNNPPTIPIELTKPSYDPGLLTHGTTYYWYVIARDGRGRVTSPVWSFTTGIESPDVLNKVFLPLAKK